MIELASPESDRTHHANMMDFAICEAERIDCPGAVQGHGHVLAVDAASLKVINVSTGAAGFLDLSLDRLLGLDFAGLSQILALSDGAKSTVQALAAKIQVTPGRVQPLPLGRMREHTVMASAGIDCVLIEARLDPVDGRGEVDVATWTARFEEEISEPAQSIFRMAQIAANALRDLTGFDRVMIYRFHPDWSGEVVAEARASSLVPFLGLRYPATDIPSQARKLYTETLIREISDTAHRPVPMVLPATAQSARPIDLAPTILREVSPYHIEYLNNMGVRATLVSSILTGGQLWGLVSCHHHQSKHVPMTVRAAVLRASARMGTSIDAIVDAESTKRTIMVQRRLDEIRNNLNVDPRSIDRLLTVFRECARADGAALLIDDHVIAIGDAPASARIPALVAGLGLLAPGEVISAETLADFGFNYSAGEQPAPSAAGGVSGGVSMGAAIVKLTSVPFAFLIAFRNELVREVLWGGDPSQAAEVDLMSGKLSPRRSFATWRERVGGRCRPWGADTIANLKSFADLTIEQGALKAGARRIGSRLRAPDALRAAIMDIMPGAMILSVGIDPEGAVRAALSNTAYNATFGLSPDELEGLSIPVLLRKMGASHADVEKVKNLGTREVEVTVWSRIRGEMNIRLSRHSILDSSLPSRSENWHMLSFQDITEFRRNERALLIAHEQSNVQLRAQQNVTAGVADTMTFPLNAVAAYAQMLTGGYVDPHSLSDRIEDEENQTSDNHHRAILDDLLTAAQLVAGDRRMMMSQFDLVALAFEVVDWIKLWFDGPLPNIVIDHPAGALPISGDSRAIRQMLINLIGNAAKATLPNGTIKIELKLGADQRSLIITVNDLARGHPADLRASDDLVLASHNLSQIRAGLSFGMAMVVGLVELHKGKLAITTMPQDTGDSSGTQVQIELPHQS